MRQTCLGGVFYECIVPDTFSYESPHPLEDIEEHLNRELNLNGKAYIAQNRFGGACREWPLGVISIAVDGAKLSTVECYLPTYNDYLRSRWLDVTSSIAPQYKSPAAREASINATMAALLMDNPAFKMIGSNEELSEEEIAAIIKRIELE